MFAYYKSLFRYPRCLQNVNLDFLSKLEKTNKTKQNKKKKKKKKKKNIKKAKQTNKPPPTKKKKKKKKRQSNRVSNFRDFECSLFPKAIRFDLFYAFRRRGWGPPDVAVPFDGAARLVRPCRDCDDAAHLLQKQ